MFVGINSNLNFDCENNSLIYDFNGIPYFIQNIENVFVSIDNNILVLLTRGKAGDLLYGIKLDGEKVFEVGVPEHYEFWYLADYDRVACKGIDEFAKKSPHSGWFFDINLENGEMTIGSPVI
ncbi:hypothetical protein NNC19_20040 [Clostridium sp. SHJSY1]|uniref:hypothetical protein n=1 Tax=Clostridium sp. SHJSY1 TaxID=2942483 RepID=UPI0028767083|nr:hypothetical protein [Clostridium sp. SHJSY1]MDS0527988.1 hypothetical protein [Clostridium sp. SHJSY1]